MAALSFLRMQTSGVSRSDSLATLAPDDAGVLAASPSLNGDPRRMVGEGQVVPFRRSRPVDDITWQKRLNRLADGEVLTLYHATSRAAAAHIDHTKQLWRGKTGIAGGAIYFAQDERAARHKSRTTKEIVYEVKVKMGVSKFVMSKVGGADYLGVGYHGVGVSSLFFQGRG